MPDVFVEVWTGNADNAERDVWTTESIPVAEGNYSESSTGCTVKIPVSGKEGQFNVTFYPWTSVRGVSWSEK